MSLDIANVYKYSKCAIVWGLTYVLIKSQMVPAKANLIEQFSSYPPLVSKTPHIHPIIRIN